MLYGLLAPPLVWAVELYLNFGLASHACFPDEAPRASFLPGWERIWIVLLVVNLVCAGDLRDRPPRLRIFLASLARRTRLSRGKSAGSPILPRDGLRSFAVSGLMVSGLFTVAIVFNTLYLWALSTCSQV